MTQFSNSKKNLMKKTMKQRRVSRFCFLEINK